MIGGSNGCGLCRWSSSGKVGAYDGSKIYNIIGTWQNSYAIKIVNPQYYVREQLLL